MCAHFIQTSVKASHWNTHPHTSTHTYTNKLQRTGTCFLSKQACFKCCNNPWLYEKVVLQFAPDGRIGTLAQPVSLRPPSARWAGTCTAAAESGLTSSALPPARAPSSAFPPGPRWSSREEEEQLTNCAAKSPSSHYYCGKFETKKNYGHTSVYSTVWFGCFPVYVRFVFNCTCDSTLWSRTFISSFHYYYTSSCCWGTLAETGNQSLWKRSRASCCSLEFWK